MKHDFWYKQSPKVVNLLFFLLLVVTLRVGVEFLCIANNTLPRKLFVSIKCLPLGIVLFSNLLHFLPCKGIDPVKLERIQLPAQHAEERNSYNHVLAEGLIRIMNYAAQPGITFIIFVFFTS